MATFRRRGYIRTYINDPARSIPHPKSRGLAMDLSGKRWEALTPAARRTAARALAKDLPTGFTFDAVRSCRLGEVRRAVAFFRRGESRFALIPGGTVEVGYDRNRRWVPNPDELDSWTDTGEEYGRRGSVTKHIAWVTTKRRKIKLAPLLVETIAGEVGWEPAPLDDPEVRQIRRSYRRAPQITVYRDGVSTRVRRLEDGTVVAERSRPRTHGQLAAELRTAGFRFPTSDEWEYLCGAGTPTLFRWGDHVPCDRYPITVGPKWDLHLRPNAFGLHIAYNPYHMELVAEVGTTRGGDGGHMICGGAGFFVGWLTLATAYFEREACTHDPKQTLMEGYSIGRRVLELS
jgi:hypothetical protein